MNATAETVTTTPTPPEGNGAATPAPAGKKARQVEKVKMEDGREVEFVGKANFYKDVLVKGKPIEECTPEELASATPSDVAIRMDFRNGTTRTYPVNPALTLYYVGHGGKQKYGDELSGEDAPDLDDWAATTDRLHERLMGGDWTKTRVGGGLAGMTILVQALMEFTGRSAQEVREHIKDWTKDQRDQLKLDPEIKPIVDRIEKEKAAKAAHVDTGALKASLRALAT